MRRVPKRRIVIVAPLSESGSMIALTREPSGRRASTIGWASSRRRPSGAMIRSIVARRCLSLVNCLAVRSIRPLRSMKMLSRAVDHDFADVGLAQQVFERP